MEINILIFSPATALKIFIHLLNFFLFLHWSTCSNFNETSNKHLQLHVEEYAYKRHKCTFKREREGSGEIKLQIKKLTFLLSLGPSTMSNSRRENVTVVTEEDGDDGY